MKILCTIVAFFFAAANLHANAGAIDLSIVFKNSQTYSDLTKKYPKQRHLLIEESMSPEWVQIAIVEDHPTHVVTLERLRIYSDGRIERLVLREYGEEAWIPDNRPNKNPSEQAGNGQPATRPESKSEGSDKPQPEAEGRSR